MLSFVHFCQNYAQRLPNFLTERGYHPSKPPGSATYTIPLKFIHVYFIDTSSDKATLQRLSKRYIEVRKTCMEKVKSGNVSFPVAVDQGGPPCDVHTELYQQILRLFELILKEVT